MFQHWRETLKRYSIAPFQKQLPVTGLDQAKHDTEHSGKYQDYGLPRKRLEREVYNFREPFPPIAEVSHQTQFPYSHGGSACREQPVDCQDNPGNASRDHERGHPRLPHSDKNRAESEGIEPQPINEKVAQRDDRNDHRDEHDKEYKGNTLSHGDVMTQSVRELSPE